MTEATVLLEYVKPVSREYKTEILVLSDERYKENLKYMLPVDTELTKEAGSVELQLSFIYIDMDADGNTVQRVRKTSPAIKVEIIPLDAWCDIVPDSALSAIDQRIIKTDAQLKALADLNTVVIDSKADNITYDKTENSIQLLSGDNLIGDKIILNNGESVDDSDGFSIVDIGE